VKDKKLLLVGISLLLLPLSLVIFGGDRFRYPCQDPENWTKPICQKPACDVTRTCVEHVFKGQRDPRLGPPEEAQNILAKQQLNTVNTAPTCPPVQQGENCAK
jgi:hypothetical protein